MLFRSSPLPFTKGSCWIIHPLGLCKGWKSHSLGSCEGQILHSLGSCKGQNLHSSRRFRVSFLALVTQYNNPAFITQETIWHTEHGNREYLSLRLILFLNKKTYNSPEKILVLNMTAKLPELLLYLHNEICLSIGFVIMTIKTYHTHNNCCLQATPPPSCNNNVGKKPQ
jgi:hypothetical protein